MANIDCRVNLPRWGLKRSGYASSEFVDVVCKFTPLWGGGGGENPPPKSNFEA